MKKVIIPLIIVIVVLGLVAWKLLMPQLAGNSPVTTRIEPTAVPPLSTLKDLLTKGVSQECTYSYADAQTGKSEGTMYIANGKMSGDFTLTSLEGELTRGRMINDGAYTYTWDDATKTGMKIAMTESLEKAGEDAIANNPQVFEMDKKTDYRCRLWVADPTRFIPPTDVQFTDLSQMMENLPQVSMPIVTTTMEGGTVTVDQCQICDSLPAEAQSSCRTSFNCQ